MSLWLPDDTTLLANPELLKESLSRYRRLLHGDGYAFWEWGMHNGTYRCGGSFWEKLGYESVDDSVTSIDSVQEYVHPDDFAYVYKVVLDHLRHNSPIDMVYRIRAKDGTYYWTQASASSTRDEQGLVTYLTGVNFDLSHLKDTEKALRLSEARHERVLTSSNDGIWEWSATDANEVPTKAGRRGEFHTSHSFWAHLGYSEGEVDSLPEDERLSIWRSHVHPHDLPKLNHAMLRHIASRTPFDFEYRVFGEQGEMFWLRARGTSIFNTHGRLILMSGININITEVKEFEERLLKAKEDAERANRSKSNFLSSISHELRTPLNAILGFSRLFESDQKLSKLQRENATYINEAGHYLLQLIDDVLDLAQIEAGKLSLSMEPVEPASLVGSSFLYCKAMARDRNISLEVDFGQLQGCNVRADAVRLRQCLLNLLSNAIKYNVDGGRVDVSFKEVSGDLEISVKDTGPGIPADKQASLFEMFNRLGAERSTIEGSGVGLVITRQLVTAMGGNLEYCHQSAPGACFKIYFPLLDEQPQELVPQMVVGRDQVMSLNFTDTKTIFYIDDNPSNIRLLGAWLQPYKELNLLCEADPMLGLYKIRTKLPDMILLDINLPGISGYDLLKILKQDPLTQHLPIVAMTANAMAEDVEYGRKMGFDEYLTKPLDIDKLALVLNFLFDRQAA
jgi:PAS domain S-box-containing protein